VIGSNQGGRNWGDRGDWTAVRSRKRKAIEQEHRGRDRSRGSDGQRGTTICMGLERHQVYGRGFLDDRRDRVDSNGRSDIGFSNKVGGHVVSAEWHATGSVVSGIKGEERQVEADNMMRVGSVEVAVRNVRKVQKIRSAYTFKFLTYFLHTYLDHYTKFLRKKVAQKFYY